MTPLDPDPLHVEDDHRIPTPWEYQRSPAPEPRLNRGCLWALLGCIAFWVAVVALFVGAVL